MFYILKYNSLSKLYFAYSYDSNLVLFFLNKKKDKFEAKNIN